MVWLGTNDVQKVETSGTKVAVQFNTASIVYTVLKTVYVVDHHGECTVHISHRHAGSGHNTAYSCDNGLTYV